ncbi:MAG: DsbA family protein, partial [Pseudomonadota bacterium]|nr:DsbA family protein [Pseudomonadota bacterium]
MRILIAICLVLTTMVPSLARADLDATDRATLNSIIEDFIRNNPEVVRDTLIALAAREEAERKQTGLAMLRDDLGDPVMGNPDGKITLYEFSDYNCGYCKRVFEPIQQLLRDNQDVRLVIKEFPILSQSSLVAAKAAIAAEMQGKFSAYHIAMMTYRGQITEDVVMRLAAQAGIDEKQLKISMESQRTATIIQRTREAAAALEINGTPGLVVGNTVVAGAIGFDELVKLIAEERSKQG